MQWEKSNINLCSSGLKLRLHIEHGEIFLKFIDSDAVELNCYWKFSPVN